MVGARRKLRRAQDSSAKASEGERRFARSQEDADQGLESRREIKTAIEQGRYRMVVGGEGEREEERREGVGGGKEPAGWPYDASAPNLVWRH